MPIKKQREEGTGRIDANLPFNQEMQTRELITPKRVAQSENLGTTFGKDSPLAFATDDITPVDLILAAAEGITTGTQTYAKVKKVQFDSALVEDEREREIARIEEAKIDAQKIPEKEKDWEKRLLWAGVQDKAVTVGGKSKAEIQSILYGTRSEALTDTENISNTIAEVKKNTLDRSAESQMTMWEDALDSLTERYPQYAQGIKELIGQEIDKATVKASEDVRKMGQLNTQKSLVLLQQEPGLEPEDLENPEFVRNWILSSIEEDEIPDEDSLYYQDIEIMASQFATDKKLEREVTNRELTFAVKLDNLINTPPERVFKDGWLTTFGDTYKTRNPIRSLIARGAESTGERGADPYKLGQVGNLLGAHQAYILRTMDGNILSKEINNIDWDSAPVQMWFESLSPERQKEVEDAKKIAAIPEGDPIPLETPIDMVFRVNSTRNIIVEANDATVRAEVSAGLDVQSGGIFMDSYEQARNPAVNTPSADDAEVSTQVIEAEVDTERKAPATGNKVDITTKLTDGPVDNTSVILDGLESRLPHPAVPASSASRMAMQYAQHHTLQRLSMARNVLVANPDQSSPEEKQTAAEDVRKIAQDNGILLATSPETVAEVREGDQRRSTGLIEGWQLGVGTSFTENSYPYEFMSWSRNNVPREINASVKNAVAEISEFEILPDLLGLSVPDQESTEAGDFTYFPNMVYLTDIENAIDEMTPKGQDKFQGQDELLVELMRAKEILSNLKTGLKTTALTAQTKNGQPLFVQSGDKTKLNIDNPDVFESLVESVVVSEGSARNPQTTVVLDDHLKDIAGRINDVEDKDLVAYLEGGDDPALDNDFETVRRLTNSFNDQGIAYVPRELKRTFFTGILPTLMGMNSGNDKAFFNRFYERSRTPDASEKWRSTIVDKMLMESTSVVPIRLEGNESDSRIGPQRDTYVNNHIRFFNWMENPPTHLTPNPAFISDMRVSNPSANIGYLYKTLGGLNNMGMTAPHYSTSRGEWADSDVDYTHRWNTNTSFYGNEDAHRGEANKFVSQILNSFVEEGRVGMSPQQVDTLSGFAMQALLDVVHDGANAELRDGFDDVSEVKAIYNHTMKGGRPIETILDDDTGRTIVSSLPNRSQITFQLVPTWNTSVVGSEGDTTRSVFRKRTPGSDARAKWFASKNGEYYEKSHHELTEAIIKDIKAGHLEISVSIIPLNAEEVSEAHPTFRVLDPPLDSETNQVMTDPLYMMYDSKLEIDSRERGDHFSASKSPVPAGARLATSEIGRKRLEGQLSQMELGTGEMSVSLMSAGINYQGGAEKYQETYKGPDDNIGTTKVFTQDTTVRSSIPGVMTGGSPLSGEGQAAYDVTEYGSNRASQEQQMIGYELAVRALQDYAQTEEYEEATPEKRRETVIGLLEVIKTDMFEGGLDKKTNVIVRSRIKAVLSRGKAGDNVTYVGKVSVGNPEDLSQVASSEAKRFFTIPDEVLKLYDAAVYQSQKRNLGRINYDVNQDMEPALNVIGDAFQWMTGQKGSIYQGGDAYPRMSSENTSWLRWNDRYNPEWDGHPSWAVSQRFAHAKEWINTDYASNGYMALIGGQSRNYLDHASLGFPLNMFIPGLGGSIRRQERNATTATNVNRFILGDTNTR